MTTFVTHARTLTELRDEFLSDIARRLRSINLQIKHSPSARGAARLTNARTELESLEEFWKEVELKNAKKGQSNAG